jgi:cytoskeletal protein CcmA (bactofilin family)
MFRRKQSSKAKIDTLIGAQTRINGDVEFTGGFHLDGYIGGNVKGAQGALTYMCVSEQGRVEGSVAALNIVLNGLVRGDVEATGRLELGSKARVDGNVHYAVIEMAVGAQINGKLIHSLNKGTSAAKSGPNHDAGLKEAP